MQIEHPVTLYLPATRGVIISPFGGGNLKIGPNVFTYDRLPGNPMNGDNWPDGGTCPGATAECEAICYAKRVNGIVRDVWKGNSGTPSFPRNTVPPLPAEATIIRAHVSGDFDSVEYIDSWIQRLTERPDVTFWAYTKSWRVPSLLAALERLRALHNVQLFASMDASDDDMPPAGWRRAWIWRDRISPEGWPMEARLIPRSQIDRLGEGIALQQPRLESDHNMITFDGVPAYVCPEESGRAPNCEKCAYCFRGQKNDVVFLEH